MPSHEKMPQPVSRKTDKERGDRAEHVRREKGDKIGERDFVLRGDVDIENGVGDHGEREKKRSVCDFFRYIERKKEF